MQLLKYGKQNQGICTCISYIRYCVDTLEGHTKWVRALAITEDGSYLASCSSDQSVIVWDMKTKEIVTQTYLHQNVVECIDFSTKEANKILARVYNSVYFNQ